MSSGKSIKEYIAGKGLPQHQYYYRKKKYGDSDHKPSNKFIQIDSVESLNSEIRLEYPNGGVRLKSQKLYQGSNFIDLEKCIPGIYYIMITERLQKVFETKLIKVE